MNGRGNMESAGHKTVLTSASCHGMATEMTGPPPWHRDWDSILPRGSLVFRTVTRHISCLRIKSPHSRKIRATGQPTFRNNSVTLLSVNKADIARIPFVRSKRRQNQETILSLLPSRLSLTIIGRAQSDLRALYKTTHHIRNFQGHGIRTRY